MSKFECQAGEPPVFMGDEAEQGIHLGVEKATYTVEAAPANLAEALNDIWTLRQNAMLEVNAFSYKPNKDLAEIVKQQDILKFELAKCSSMSDKLSLFFDKRLSELSTLDIGDTLTPGGQDALRIKHEYIEMRNTLINEQVIERELPREQAERKIVFRQLQDNPDYTLGTRKRELFHFNEAGRQMSLLKQMVFLAPIEVAPQDGWVAEADIAKIESLLDSNDQSITPVRTIYYAKDENLVVED